MELPEVTFWPENKKIRIRPGTTLLEASRKAKVNIRSRCEAKAACLMCKVIVKDQDGLEPMKQNERFKLGGLAAKGYRLACQARVKADVQATIPEDPLKAAIRAQLAKQKEDDDWI